MIYSLLLFESIKKDQPMLFYFEPVSGHLLATDLKDSKGLLFDSEEVRWELVLPKW